MPVPAFRPFALMVEFGDHPRNHKLPALFLREALWWSVKFRLKKIKIKSICPLKPKGSKSFVVDFVNLVPPLESKSQFLELFPYIVHVDVSNSVVVT
jgi:hypothetical protein